MSKQKGFTLIELLVVVGIIAILAIAALIAINPAEAQRRSRDTVRFQDLARIQAAVETEIDTNGYANFTNGNTTSTGAAAGSDPCVAGNWIGPNLCHTLRQVPVAPLNDQNLAFLTAAPGTTQNVASLYAIFLDAVTGQYEICTRLEGAANQDRLAADGVADDLFSAGSQVGLGCDPT